MKTSSRLWLILPVLFLWTPVPPGYRSLDGLRFNGEAEEGYRVKPQALQQQTASAERRITPIPGGWVVETLERTGDRQMPLLHVRKEYADSVADGNLVNRNTWLADRIVLSVSADAGILDPEAEELLLGLGLVPQRSFSFSPVRVYGLPETELGSVERWLAILGGQLRGSGITVSRDNLLYPVSTTPDDPRLGEQWALQHIRAPEAWDYTTGSTGAIVAVIDSGLNMEHEDFYEGEQNNLWINPGDPADGIDNDGNGLVDDSYGWDFVNESGILIEDTSGHGTAVSGILGARGNNGAGISGVAWEMQVLPMRAGEVAFPNSVLAQAMDYVTDLRLRGYPIVATSNSYGYYPYENPTPEEWAVSDEPLAHAIERARQAGILVVTASGNGGQNNDSPYTRHFYPSDANHHNIISVNALDTTGSLWRGSNYGVESVDLAAPGLGILTTYRDGNYRIQSGTSMAAPHVSGASALLASLRPGLNVSWMRSLILGASAPHESLEGKVSTGGSLDLSAMLEMATLSPEEAWKRLFWSETELAQMNFSWDDNPDADAWSNLEELAYGGNPRAADSVAAVYIEEATLQRGKSEQTGILATLHHIWSPLADGCVARYIEYSNNNRGPWIPAIPVRYELVGDDLVTGIRIYQGYYSLPRSPASMRVRLELGEQNPVPGRGRLRSSLSSE